MSVIMCQSVRDNVTLRNIRMFRCISQAAKVFITAQKVCVVLYFILINDVKCRRHITMVIYGYAINLVESYRQMQSKLGLFL